MYQYWFIKCNKRTITNARCQQQEKMEGVGMDPLYYILNMLYSKIALKQNLVIKKKSYLEIPVLNSEEKMGVTESK